MDRSQIDTILAKTMILKGWSVERLIGEGRFGRVYAIRREGPFGGTMERAALKWARIAPTQEEINRCPALGMTMEDLADLYRQKVEACAREIEIMRSLQGETNIVNYQDFEVRPIAEGIGWDLFIRMEQLTPILRYISQEGVSIEMIVDVGKSVAAALSLCHHPRVGVPVIHGDVKLGNVYFAREHTFKLGDFGLSFLEGRGGDSGGGTRGYLAPECVAGAQKTVLSDQYALGKTLLALWTFVDKCPEDEESDSPAAQARHNLWKVIQTATAQSPQERYCDINDMLRALNAITEPNTQRVHTLSAEEYLLGPGRSGDTKTDLRQREAQQEVDDILSGVELPDDQEDAALDAGASEDVRPRISQKYDDWTQGKRGQERRQRKKVLTILTVAVASLALAVAMFFLLRPGPAQVSQRYKDAHYSLYRYKMDYAATASAVVKPGISSIWQEVLNSDWSRRVSSLSTDAGNGYGYVLVVSPSGGVGDIALSDCECRVEFSSGGASAVAAASCENATSMLTINLEKTWLTVDLTPVIQKLRVEKPFASGETYSFTCFLDGEIFAVFEGTFA